MARPTREVMKEQNRPARISVHEANRNKTSVKGLDHDNFQYRWVNDTEGRLPMFEQAGYEYVYGSGESVGDGGVDQSHGTSSKITKGMGGGVIAYLMRIPRDLWLEDQKKKDEEMNSALEREIKKNVKEIGGKGQINIVNQTSR